jgi:Arc/MetJ-type ribon-helix-helix transcriptional regulator
MKLSVSLPSEDVEFLDAYARAHAFASRSAVVHAAISSLRQEDLPDAYRDAWAEWEPDGEAWERAVGDGL